MSGDLPQSNGRMDFYISGYACQYCLDYIDKTGRVFQI